MRKLYSYRNRLSTRGTTTITDENGSNVYLINGRWGMHAGVMSVYSSSNLLEAEIKQRSLGMLPKFDLYKKRKYAGSIRRYYGVSREMLFVKKLNWLIMGNLSTYNYRVFHGRECIMTINEVQAEIILNSPFPMKKMRHCFFASLQFLIIGPKPGRRRAIGDSAAAETLHLTKALERKELTI